MQLTPADVYQALAAKPYRQAADREDLEGRRSRAAGDRDPGLRPAVDVAARATRFAELILEKGCDSDPAMKALKDSDEDKHEGDLHRGARGRRLCRRGRERQSDRPEDRRQSRRDRRVRLLLPRGERRQAAGRRDERRRADLRDDRQTSAIPARARSTSTSRARTSNAIPGLSEFVAEWAQRVGPGRLSQAPRPDRRRPTTSAPRMPRSRPS